MALQKKVYISSTYKDLETYRTAIREMFFSKGIQEEYELIGMEGYVSVHGKKAIDVCLEDVRNVDIYILILAKRYGSLVEGTTISYTEAEYGEALKMAAKKPSYRIFAFYSKDEIEHQDFKDITGLENPALEHFYARVLKDNASFTQPFTNADNLCKQILLTFNYNFKKLVSITDYTDALMILDRNEQSYSFSKSLRFKTNSFYFTSVHKNCPVDFLERLYDLEMGGMYQKCRVELSHFNSAEADKFKEAFIAQLSVQWGEDMDGYHFGKTTKYFLSIEITSEQIKSDYKMNCMYDVLIDFLPAYLTTAAEPDKRVFFIFYHYTVGAGETPDTSKFDVFVSKLKAQCNINGALAALNPLNDVTRTDARNWLDTFIAGQSFDEDAVDTILQTSEDPFKVFKMKEIKKLIKDWIEIKLLKN